MDEGDGDLAIHLRSQQEPLIPGRSLPICINRLQRQLGGIVKKNRLSFSLIAFCTVTVLAAALGLSALFAATAAAFAGGGNPVLSADDPVNPETTEAVNTPGGKTYVGMITDDHCGARHEMKSGLDPSECARMCVRNGSKYALVDGDRRYTLDGKRG